MSYELSRCPSCGHQRLTTVSVDDDLLIRVCDGCDRAYGVDDSMDAETLALLLVDEELCRDVQMTAVTCDQCLNDDVDLFEIVDELDPDRLALRVMCLVCSSVSDVSLKSWTSDVSWIDDDAWMTEVLGNMDGRYEEDSGSVCSDADSGYVVDSEDGYDIGGGNNVGMGLDVVPFSCQCGNNEVDCFEKYYDACGDLSRVTCLVCDRQKVVDTFFGVECWHCKNDSKELFEKRVDDYGRIALLRCLVCDKHLRLPGQPSPAPRKERTDDGPGWTKIADLRHVQRGDHVAWHNWYAIWHHAIVVDIPDGGRALTVIHYSSDIGKQDGHCASVRLETLNVNPHKEDLYRMDYPPGNVYPVEEVIERAVSRLGEAKYNPLANNCEHFARWCKTGRAQCGQVRVFADRLKLATVSTATKTIQEVAADGIETLVTGSIRRFCIRGIRQRAGQAFGATSGVVRNVKCGALACNVAINFVVEAGMFAKDAIEAYRRHKSGAISREDFRQQLCKVGCECTGGLIGGSAMGILGQVLVPVPIVGGLVGSTVGNLIGRFIGAVTGKQVGAIKH